MICYAFVAGLQQCGMSLGLKQCGMFVSVNVMHATMSHAPGGPFVY